MRRTAISITALCALAAPSFAEQKIGSASTIEKDVHGATTDRSMKLRAGDEVYFEEVLTTGAASRGKFNFDDRTNLQMGPSSKVRLDSFVYAGNNGVAFSAAKGAFRFVSSPAHKNYEVRTPTATIGVRGTAFGVRARQGSTDAVLYGGVIEVCQASGANCRILDKPCTTVTVTDAGVSAPRTVGKKDWSFDKTCKGAPPPGPGGNDVPPPPPGDVPPGGPSPFDLGSVPVNWGGLSIGFNVGTAIGNAEFADPVPMNGVGFLGGLKLGYNWQVLPNIVAGFETDAEYRSEIGGSTNGHGTVSSTRGGYLGTFRGRLGYAFNRWLVYGTGGLAYGHIIAPRTFSGANLLGPAYAFGTSQNNPFLAGWTVGGGVQFALTSNISVKAEYLYVKLQHDYPTYATNVALYPVPICNMSGLHSIRAGVSYGFSLTDLFSGTPGR